MKKFKKILVVYTGKAEGMDALKRAFYLSKHNKARLTVVDVIANPPQKSMAFLGAVTGEALMETVRDEKLTEIKGAIKRLEGYTKIKADVKVLTGKPHIEIIKEVLKNGHDLVMKATEGNVGAKELLFGSVDINLMRKCPCPVWMVKPSKSKKYARILAAVDPDPFDKESDELNGVIMEIAVSVSISEKSELHIVHAWSMFGERLLREPRFKKTEMEIRKLLLEAKISHKQRLEKLIYKSGLGKLKHTVHLLKGDPSEIIPNFAKRRKIDLIVMGTICRTGLPGFIIGNTAESILNRVSCSVLTVKPAGFVTPVKL